MRTLKPLDLLGACFHCEPSRLGLLPPSVNWENVIQVAERQFVLPALHTRLNLLGGSPQLPAEVADFLAAVELLNGDRNQAIFAELAYAATLLNGVGIEPVVLKGAAYCIAGVYTSSAQRYLWDVDLLVAESQLPLAVAILKQNHFESEQDYALGHFRHHHPPLQRKGSVHFELHHSLGMGVCKSLLPAADVIADSRAHDFCGARVRIPSAEHLAAHLIMHSQIQHPYNERIWPPLRAMLDLVLLRGRFDSQIDWAAVESRFRQADQSRVLALHLLQVRDALGAETPLPIHLTGLTWLCWQRRKLLQAWPVLRFLDPFYMYSTVLLRRQHLLRNALAAPGGWKQIVKELLAPRFYRRFLTDIAQGRGR